MAEKAILANWRPALHQKTLTIGESITVWLTSCLTGLDSTKQAKLVNRNKIKQEVNRTVILSLMLVFSDYSDLSPYGECSLTPASNNVRGCLGTNSVTRLHDF